MQSPESARVSQDQERQPQSQESVVFSVVALASLFHNTLESFGNIHSSFDESKDERILFCQLGIEQARLMIWGDLVGILSPPSSIAEQSGALKPVVTQEGVKRPLYSRPRDERLDDDSIRHEIEGILSALSYTLSPPAFDYRLDVNGLKPWQQGYAHTLEQPAVNDDRLARLEDRYNLLLDTAASKSGLGRPGRHTTTQWLISDMIRFSNFVKFVKLHVDKLVQLLHNADAIEEVLKHDVSLLGETAATLSTTTSNPRKRIGKLKTLVKACKGWYPLLGLEAKAALQKLQAETGEPDHSAHRLPRLGTTKLPMTPKSQPASPDGKRPGLFSRLSTQTAHTFSRKSRAGTPAGSAGATPAASRGPSRAASPEPAE